MAAVDHDETVWLAGGESAVALADACVKFDRFLFHPIVRGNGTDPSQHSRASGLDINVVGGGAFTAAQQPYNFMGFPGTTGQGTNTRYVFDDKVRMPNMTYALITHGSAVVASSPTNINALIATALPAIISDGRVP